MINLFALAILFGVSVTVITSRWATYLSSELSATIGVGASILYYYLYSLFGF